MWTTLSAPAVLPDMSKAPPPPPPRPTSTFVTQMWRTLTKTWLTWLPPVSDTFSGLLPTEESIWLPLQPEPVLVTDRCTTKRWSYQQLQPYPAACQCGHAVLCITSQGCQVLCKVHDEEWTSLPAHHCEKSKDSLSPKAVQKLMINSVGESDFSAQETCHLLLQLPMFKASRDFVVLSWTDLVPLMSTCMKINHQHCCQL